MGARSQARESALQMLYALEVCGAGVEQVIHDFWREAPGDAEGREFADRLVRGVAADLEELDRRLGAASRHWRLERMARVDRNVLRLATWELLRAPETPRAVVLDEAVELAKRFGTADSGAFVNGVLVKVAEDAGRPAGS